MNLCLRKRCFETSHSETTAIREACKELKTSNLDGTILYASLQPCLMCFSVANWAGISKIIYGCRKTKDMVANRYYEGVIDITKVNQSNTRKIELKYIPDFEKESLEVVQMWEEQQK